jgi:hypothetical protein
VLLRGLIAAGGAGASFGVLLLLLLLPDAFLVSPDASLPPTLGSLRAAAAVVVLDFADPVLVLLELS